MCIVPKCFVKLFNPYSDAEESRRAEAVKVGARSEEVCVCVCASIKNGTNCECRLLWPFSTAEKFGANSHSLSISASKAVRQQTFSLHGAKPFLLPCVIERCHLHVAVASRIWTHTFFISTVSIFATAARRLCVALWIRTFTCLQLTVLPRESGRRQ